MYQEGQPRRLALRKGDRVRVRGPGGKGTVHAVIETPAERGGKVQNAWIRYLDGPEAGELARIDCAYIEPV